MADWTFARTNHHPPTEIHETVISRDDEPVLVPVSHQTIIERYPQDALSLEPYRQPVDVTLMNPDIERRLDYFTAMRTVTKYGTGRSGSDIRIYPYLLFIDFLLFFVAVVVLGVFIGVLVGMNLIPVETLPVLLIVAIGIVLLLIGFVLGNAIWTSRSFEAVDTLVPEQTSRTIVKRVNGYRVMNRRIY